MSSTFYCAIASLESEVTSISAISSHRFWFFFAVFILVFFYLILLGTFNEEKKEASGEKKQKNPSKTIKSELRFAAFAIPSALVIFFAVKNMGRFALWFLLLIVGVLLLVFTVKSFRDSAGLSVKQQLKNYFGGFRAIEWIGFVVAPIVIASALALYGASFYLPNLPVVKPTCSSDCSDVTYVLSSVAGEDLDVPTYNIRPGYSRTVIDFSECQFADQQKKSSGSSKNRRVYWHTDRQYSSISGTTSSGDYRSFTITGKTERHGMKVYGGTFYECTISWDK